MFTKKSLKANRQSILYVVTLILIFTLVLGPTASTSFAAPIDDGPLYEGEPATPLQIDLANTISQRHAAGLPVPDVSYSTQLDGVRSFDELARPQTEVVGSQETTVTAVTVIYFQGPQEAGYDEWPALELTGKLGGDESAAFASGDLSEVLRAGMEEQIPGFWQQVEFGQEARRYTIKETYIQTTPSEDSLIGSSMLASSQATTTGDVLMGFTYTGPKIENYIETKAEGCVLLICGTIYEIKAGFELDWALGLRLPASATLTAPAGMVQGNSYTYQTSLTPMDWNASQYSGYLVAPEEGNEFVLRLNYFIGVMVKLFDVDLCQAAGFTCYRALDENWSKTFTTPFGAGSSFPIPGATVPIYQLGSDSFNFKIDFTAQPFLTSDKIMADWHAVSGSDCSGSGTVTYAQPNTPVSFGPVTACNQGPTNQAQVELENFRYFFSQFLIQLSAKVSVNIFNIFNDSITKTIANFDLSSITDGLYVGDHVQCTFDFDCPKVGPGNKLLMSSTVSDETPPTTSIVLAGTAGKNGWYVSDVQVSLSAVDGPLDGSLECGSGVNSTQYSFDNDAWNDYTGPVLLTQDGSTAVYYRSVDNEGNVEATKSLVVKIDKTPPALTGGLTTMPNGYGWWKYDIVVHFDATDGGSGLFFVTPDVKLAAEGADQEVTGIAIDFAGNQAEYKISNLNLDKTPPVVVIHSPLPQIYDNSDSFIVDWTATDALSGLVTERGDLDGAPVSDLQLIELLLVAGGKHTVTVLAVDYADNAAAQKVDFFVQVDIDDLTAQVEYMCQQGWIKTPGVCNSLLAKLYNAKKAMERDQCRVTEKVLEAFIHEVEAQDGKQLTEQAAEVLKGSALYVISGLECTVFGP